MWQLHTKEKGVRLAVLGGPDLGCEPSSPPIGVLLVPWQTVESWGCAGRPPAGTWSPGAFPTLSPAGARGCLPDHQPLTAQIKMSP